MTSTVPTTRRLFLGNSLKRAALSAAAAVVIATSGAAALPLPAAHAANASVSYQIKLQLDPAKVLDTQGNFTTAAKQALSIGSASGKENAQYFDDSAKDLATEGWSIRLLREPGKDGIKLTFKKRYDIAGDGTSSKDINKALDNASNDGFDSKEDSYAGQVNMSYSKSTLDFSNKKKGSSNGLSDGELPDSTGSREAILDTLPGKLDRWKSKNWARGVVNKGRNFGPVTETDFPGTIKGHSVELQVTPLKINGKNTFYVEASTETDSQSEAVTIRKDVINDLDSRGWLFHQNAFKTDLVLANY